MFSEAPFCDNPIASFSITTDDGEIFYFTGNIQALREFISEVTRSERFIQSINTSDGHIVNIDRVFPSELSIKREAEHTGVR